MYSFSVKCLHFCISQHTYFHIFFLQVARLTLKLMSNDQVLIRQGVVVVALNAKIHRSTYAMKTKNKMISHSSSCLLFICRVLPVDLNGIRPLCGMQSYLVGSQSFFRCCSLFIAFFLVFFVLLFFVFCFIVTFIFGLFKDWNKQLLCKSYSNQI